MKLMGHAEAVEHLGPRAKSTAFGIKSTGKAFDILSSKLYKDKIKAIVREVSCNAFDSHIAAGHRKPFVVHLPSDFEPWFTVRDFGVGLTEEQLTNIYTTFFESTKEDTNDFIGALGLGTKSPFSYVDSFTVTSYLDGIRKVFECYKDMGVPHIVKRSEVPTNEDRGLEVTVPVQKEDVEAFRNAARSIYQWFDPRPTIANSKDFQITPPLVFKGCGWSSVGGSWIEALMGQVSYPIDKSIIGEAELSGVVIKFELGDVDVQAGREGLSYDKATIEKIKSRVAEVKTEIRKKHEKMFARCKNIFEAETHYEQLRYKEQSFLHLSPEFRGHKLNQRPVHMMLKKYGHDDVFKPLLPSKKPDMRDLVIFKCVRADNKDMKRFKKWHRENPTKFGHIITPKLPYDPEMVIDLADITIIESSSVSLPHMMAKLRSFHNYDARLSQDRNIDISLGCNYILTRNLLWAHPSKTDQGIGKVEAKALYTILKSMELEKKDSVYIPWTRKSIINENCTNLYDLLHQKYLEEMNDSTFATLLQDARAWKLLKRRVNPEWFSKLERVKLPNSPLNNFFATLLRCREAYIEHKNWLIFEDLWEIKISKILDLDKQWQRNKQQYPLVFRMLQPDRCAADTAITDQIAFMELAVYVSAKGREKKMNKLEKSA